MQQYVGIFTAGEITLVMHTVHVLFDFRRITFSAYPKHRMLKAILQALQHELDYTIKIAKCQAPFATKSKLMQFIGFYD